MSTLTMPAPVHLGHTVVHAPVPGFEPMATCCTSVPGGGQCTWHTEDHEHARALAVQHAAAERHRVMFDDSDSTTLVVPS